MDSSKEKSNDPDFDVSFDLLSKIVDGALGGFLGTLALFPLDTVKTRLQSQKKGVHANWINILGKIVRQEGFKGLYKGFGVTLALVTPELTAKLVTYDYVTHHLQLSDGDLTMAQKTFAAAVAGFVQIHITTPSELIKVQLQTHSVKRKSKCTQFTLQAWDVFRNLVQNEGITGLFRGYLITILRDVNFAMIYFPLYAGIIGYGPPSKKDIDRPADWVAFGGGCIAGLVAALVVTPFDVIKTRMQSDIHSHDGMLHSFRKIVESKGFKALFAGASCRCLLIAPLLGICQTVYSFNTALKIKMLLDQSEGGSEL